MKKTSKTIGVCWCKVRKKWIAYIRINNKHTYLGAFDLENDAIAKRLKAEKIKASHKDLSYLDMIDRLPKRLRIPKIKDYERGRKLIRKSKVSMTIRPCFLFFYPRAPI